MRGRSMFNSWLILCLSFFPQIPLCCCKHLLPGLFPLSPQLFLCAVQQQDSAPHGPPATSANSKWCHEIHVLTNASVWLKKTHNIRKHTVLDFLLWFGFKSDIQYHWGYNIVFSCACSCHMKERQNQHLCPKLPHIFTDASWLSECDSNVM